MSDFVHPISNHSYYQLHNILEAIEANFGAIMKASTPGRSFTPYTGCLKIREFQIQSVVGDHFSSPNMEIKKNRDFPHKDTLVGRCTL
jgi:hypothetical protein